MYLLEQAMEGALEALGADVGFLVVEAAAGRRVVSSTGEAASALVADSLVDRALSSGAPVLVEDASRDAALAAAPSVVSLRIWGSRPRCAS